MYLKALIGYIVIFLWFSSIDVKFSSKFVVFAEKSPTSFVVLNALDLPGFDGALSFIEQANVYTYDSRYCRYLVYLSSKYLKDIGSYGERLRELHLTIGKEIIFYWNPNKLKDHRIGIMKPNEEFVSDIITVWRLSYDSISRRLDQFKDTDVSKHVLMLSFLEGSVSLPTHLYSVLLDLIQKHDLILLDKTRRLTSVSDWHDMLMLGYHAKSAKFSKWFETFQSVYRFHTFSRGISRLLDPRPALLEASTTNKDSLNIAYFSRMDICSSMNSWTIATNRSSSVQINYEFDRRHKHPESKCRQLYNGTDTTYKPNSISSIELYCGNFVSNMVSKPCSILRIPLSWKRKINDAIPESLTEVARTSDEDLQKNVMLMMEYGILRFRNTIASQPRHFCWEKGHKQREELSTSKIECNLTESKPFSHSEYNRYLKMAEKNRRSKSDLLMLTGTSATGYQLNKYMYMSISKAYYAARHGYDYLMTASPQYVEYYPKHLYSNIDYELVRLPYFRGVMSKPVMILDVMHRYPHKKWILWSDDDEYINPGWLYVPLEVFLEDVPESKVIVMGNVPSAFTNIFFIRNTFAGRRVVRDWLAITMSGAIQCHGFDQAAMQAVVLMTISKDFSYKNDRPFNYTCLYSPTDNAECGFTPDQYSCDSKFERSLYIAGFKSRYLESYEGGKMSSYSKGCANSIIDDFHIITETATRPRLQCGTCTRLDEIDSSGDFYGPLGANNDLLRRGSINGWFFNHKSEFLFYEGYLNLAACRQLSLDDFIPICYDIENTPDAHGYEAQTLSRSYRSIISVADGYGFHLDHGKYCRIKQKELLRQQLKSTFMKEYAEFIATINKISDHDWDSAYRNHPGVGRYPCGLSNLHVPCTYGAERDGQRRRRPFPPYKDETTDLFFERDRFCETCRVKAFNNSLFPQLNVLISSSTERTDTDNQPMSRGRLEDVMDCRSQREEDDERSLRRNIDR